MQARLKSSRSLLLGSIGVAALATLCVAAPAEARPYHHYARNAHHVRVAARAGAARHYRAANQRGGRRVAGLSAPGESPAAAVNPIAAVGGAISDIVSEARHWLGGGNPTRRRTLWCASFMNFVLERTGHHGTGSDMASSFASYGHRVSGPQVGAIAVMSRKGGGHVGVVSGLDAAGNPIIISGNYGNQVREAAYHGGRIYAYVMP
jgi:uncharacterized protein (TIGR02594 family)